MFLFYSKISGAKIKQKIELRKFFLKKNYFCTIFFTHFIHQK